jgi:hypothetical protein
LDALSNNLEVNGDITTDDSKIPNDFGRLEDGVITKGETKEGNNDTKVPMDFGHLERNDLESGK